MKGGERKKRKSRVGVGGEVTKEEKKRVMVEGDQGCGGEGWGKRGAIGGGGLKGGKTEHREEGSRGG